MKLSNLTTFENERSLIFYTGDTPGAGSEDQLSGLSPQAKRYNCYSAKNCGGNLISNRDPHNCKTKSGGKSIRDTWSGTCWDL